MLEDYNYTTTDLDANYTSRNVLLAIAVLKKLMYVIKHSKYSTSFTDYAHYKYLTRRKESINAMYGSSIVSDEYFESNPVQPADED